MMVFGFPITLHSSRRFEKFQEQMTWKNVLVMHIPIPKIPGPRSSSVTFLTQRKLGKEKVLVGKLKFDGKNEKIGRCGNPESLMFFGDCLDCFQKT